MPAWFRYTIRVDVERDGRRRTKILRGRVLAPVDADPGKFGTKALRRSLHDASHSIGKRRVAE